MTAPTTTYVEPKAPRGTRDFDPDDMRVREWVISVASSVYRRHGAVQIETPTFELTSVLTGKYGEEGQGLIYNIERKVEGHEELSLRYDLTVPFARYIAQRGITTMKRYQIGRVYRRDEVSVKHGRYREFYQCDFDYAGPTDRMVADAECVAVMSELLRALGVGRFRIKVNHRGLLDAMLRVAGVKPENFRTVSSSIDKLDKLPWAAVREEIVMTKGAASEEAADAIGRFATVHGAPADVIAAAGAFAAGDDGGAAALRDLELLAKYCGLLGCAGDVEYDLSLARGLDYYTGAVFEAVLLDEEMGSIAGGGRYDDMLGMFSRGGASIPAVGFALGIERVFDIVAKKPSATKPRIDVAVIAATPGCTEYRMRVCSELWGAKVSTEMCYSDKPRLKAHLAEAAKEGARLAAIVGADEVAKETVTLKDLTTGASQEVQLAALWSTVLAVLAVK